MQFWLYISQFWLKNTILTLYLAILTLQHNSDSIKHFWLKSSIFFKQAFMCHAVSMLVCNNVISSLSRNKRLEVITTLDTLIREHLSCVRPGLAVPMMPQEPSNPSRLTGFRCWIQLWLTGLQLFIFVKRTELRIRRSSPENIRYYGFKHVCLSILGRSLSSNRWFTTQKGLIVGNNAVKVAKRAQFLLWIWQDLWTLFGRFSDLSETSLGSDLSSFWGTF